MRALREIPPYRRCDDATAAPQGVDGAAADRRARLRFDELPGRQPVLSARVLPIRPSFAVENERMVLTVEQENASIQTHRRTRKSTRPSSIHRKSDAPLVGRRRGAGGRSERRFSLHSLATATDRAEADEGCAKDCQARGLGNDRNGGPGVQRRGD